MNKIFRFAAAVITAVFALTNVTAFALSSEPTATATETVIEDSRTLTPKGNANLIDDVSEDENLQFITVTSKNGNIFYFVIDHAADNENVYFLNTVDEADLMALVEDGELTEQENAPTAPDTEQEQTEETEKTETEKEQPEQPTQLNGNNNMLLIILILLCGGGVAFYYFKVIMPKKKLEQADDIEDFEFDDEDSEDDSEYEEPDEDEIEDYNPEEYEGEGILEDSIVYADDTEDTENE